MSYRCGICNGQVPPQHPMRRHIVYRNRNRVYRKPLSTEDIALARIAGTNPLSHTEIEREVPACGSCLSAIRNGISVAELTKSRPITKEVLLGVPANNPSVRPVPPPIEPVSTLCDICSEEVGDDGQVTADHVLCRKHLPTRRSKGKT